MQLRRRTLLTILLPVLTYGQGVEKEYWDKIFNLFTTLGDKDRFGNTGTGIGLSAVKKFVEAQDGIIDFYSEPGKGTTVKFTLKKVK